MKRAFNIVHYDRIPKWVLGLHIAFANWLADHYPVSHTIKVHLVPRTCLPTHDGRFCWGYFNPGKRPNIGLACRPPRFKDGTPDRSTQIGFLLHTFAHEFVHYEQWRDGRPMTHRGVDSRVDSLVRKFEADWINAV